MMITDLELPVPETMVLLRKRYDLTQAELGEKLGKDVSTIVRWEAGKGFDDSVKILLKGLEVILCQKS